MVFELLLITRVLLLVYVTALLVRCVLYYKYTHSKKKLDRRNVLIYGLVITSFILTDLHISVNIWGLFVAGNSEGACRTWREIHIILLVVCMAPVTILLWFRQNFFYKLNMIQRTSSRLVLLASRFIIYPIVATFCCIIVTFLVVYCPSLKIMHYVVDEKGACRSGKSKKFSSLFMATGILFIITVHFVLLYLFINPLRENMASQANTGQILEVKSSCRKDGSRRSIGVHFKSIKDVDRALIKKMAAITGLVIGADIVSVLSYVILKFSGVELNTQALVFDMLVVVSSVSNVLCWKHSKAILLLPGCWSKIQAHRSDSIGSRELSCSRGCSRENSFNDNRVTVRQVTVKKAAAAPNDGASIVPLVARVADKLIKPGAIKNH